MHKQKNERWFKAVLQENELILEGDTQEDITLEKDSSRPAREFSRKYTALPLGDPAEKKF